MFLQCVVLLFLLHLLLFLHFTLPLNHTQLLFLLLCLCRQPCHLIKYLKLSVSEELLPSKYDSTDVAFYKNRINDMSEKEIFQMVKNTFSPSKQFVFPKTGKCHFRLSWLEDYSWLCSKHQWGILFTMCDFIDNICHFHHRIQNFSQRFWHMSCKLV